jgi:hypothetical protein
MRCIIPQGALAEGGKQNSPLTKWATIDKTESILTRLRELKKKYESK